MRPALWYCAGRTGKERRLRLARKYLFSCIGDVPATEDYAEGMRSLEQRYRAAEAKLIEAQALAIEAPIAADWYSAKEYCTDKDYKRKAGDDELHFQLVPATLHSTKWRLVVDEGAPIPQANSYTSGRIVFELDSKFKAMDDWGDETFYRRTYLLSEEGDARLMYRF